MAEFLTPVLVLIIWTLIVLVFMLSRRIPAMNKINRNTQKFIENPELMQQLPNKAKWAADNYNHLHEQPVIFYALMFYLAATNAGDSVNLYLAWGYVISRILHSLIQMGKNIVIARFLVFVIGTVLLMLMALRAVLALF